MPTWLKPASLAFVLMGCACARTPEPHADWPEVKEWVRGEFPDVPVATVPELHARLADRSGPPPILLDARSPEEFAVSHLDGALNTPGESEALALLAGADQSTEIVVYCSVGYRSAVLTRELTERGFTDVRNLEGSIFEWANSGYPVFRDGTAVNEVHPFDAEWGRLLDPELRAPEH